VSDPRTRIRLPGRYQDILLERMPARQADLVRLTVIGDRSATETTLGRTGIEDLIEALQEVMQADPPGASESASA
jgi:hypothetical protein